MNAFADEVRFSIKAGDGGDGAVSFRHEKWVARGGPDGGDGGDGGSIYLVADHNINTLADLARSKIYKADDGGRGLKQKSAGKTAENLYLKVPVGTQVFETAIVRGKEQSFLLADLDRSGDKALVAQGGEGGLGNSKFARPSFQTPEFAELGTPGEEKDILLKLKLIADVGLLGLPNVGKSTLLSVISNAKPKIADYEFTTLIPNLGIVKLSDTSFVVADIPGLIEGAAEGKGLGIQFLRHVERTKLLVHVLDSTHANPLADFKAINKELTKYDKTLAKLPQIVAFNKVEVLTEEERARLKKIKFPVSVKNIHFISAAIAQGTQDLVYDVAQKLSKLAPRKNTKPDIRIFTIADVPKLRFSVDKKGKQFVVSGPKQEHLALKIDFENPQAIGRFYKVLKRQGVLAALKKAGAKEGDPVKIGTKEFEFQDV